MSKPTSSALTLAVLETPDPAVSDALKAGLRAFNDQFNPPPDYLPLIIAGRDRAGTICAGFDGITVFRWLIVKALWVAKEYRRQGIGSELLRVAEATAIARKCVGVHLVTYSYQAPEFYTKHGYSETGRIKGFPSGHDQLWFHKPLSNSERHHFQLETPNRN